MINYTHPARQATSSSTPVNYTHPDRSPNGRRPVVLQRGESYSLTTGRITREA